MLETTGNPEVKQPAERLAERRAEVMRKLGAVVGDGDQALRDKAWARGIRWSMTYGQIVRRLPTTESPQLPEGAIRSNDPYVEITLQEGQLAVIDQFLHTTKTPDPPTKLAGLTVVELQNLFPENSKEYLHPKIEGYDWYRGYYIATAEAATLLLQPWTQPWLPEGGGAPFPIMYTIGEVNPCTVLGIAEAYNAHRLGLQPDSR